MSDPAPNNTGPIAIHEPWTQSPRLTNAMLVAVLTTTGGGAALGKTAYDGLAETQVQIRLELSRLSETRDHDDEWRQRHEAQPHERARELLADEADQRRKVADKLQALELRVGALESKGRR